MTPINGNTFALKVRDLLTILNRAHRTELKLKYKIINNNIHHIICSYLTEPFDLTNTARSVYDRDVFERIKAVFQASYISLKKTRDIESIFLLDDKD